MIIYDCVDMVLCLVFLFACCLSFSLYSFSGLIISTCISFGSVPEMESIRVQFSVAEGGHASPMLQTECCL